MIEVSDESSRQQARPYTQLPRRKALIAGGLTAIIVSIILYPLDCLRVLTQTSSASDASTDILRDNAKRPWVFYRGFMAAAAFTLPAHALYYGSYDLTKKITPAGGLIASFTAGLTAELAGSLLFVPQDVLKQRQMALGTSWTSIISDILTRDGVPGLWRGYWLHVMTYGPLSIIYFLTYELSIKIFNNNKILCATIAGTFGSILTTPVDVLRTRVQTDFHGCSTPIEVIIDLWENEKYPLSALFKGWIARTLYLAPGAAISRAVYEFVKDYLMDRQSKVREGVDETRPLLDSS